MFMPQQMISATEEHASSHGTHSQGVYAMLSTAGVPLFALSLAGCFQNTFQFVSYVLLPPFYNLCSFANRYNRPTTA
jgi:hypothetical protein